MTEVDRLRLENALIAIAAVVAIMVVVVVMLMLAGPYIGDIFSNIYTCEGWNPSGSPP